MQNGCILWGFRVVIPTKLRQNLLEELHNSYSGSTRMKELTRSYIWWPGMDTDLERIAQTCASCLNNRPMPSKAELHPWEWPSKPWHRIHVDYAGSVEGNCFFVVVDAHSKWVKKFQTVSMTSKNYY